MAGTSDTDKTAQKGEIPASQDVIDGAAQAKTAKHKAKAGQRADDRKTTQTLSGSRGRSGLIYLTFSLSVIALIGAFLPQLDKYFSPDAGQPAWQLARNADRADMQTAFRDIETRLSEIEVQFAQLVEETHQSQELRDAEQDAERAEFAKALEILRAEFAVLTKDIDKKLSDQIANQPPAPQASNIWFEGLATASQLGQDLGYWQSRLTQLIPPANGWRAAQQDVISALSEAETASHQSLISDAYALVEAAHLAKPPAPTEPMTDTDEDAGWLFWLENFVRFEKIEATPERLKDDKLDAFHQLVSNGALAPVAKALVAMENLDLSAVQDWQSRFESRTALDALIASAFKPDGGL